MGDEVDHFDQYAFAKLLAHWGKEKAAIRSTVLEKKGCGKNGKQRLFPNCSNLQNLKIFGQKGGTADEKGEKIILKKSTRQKHFVSESNKTIP